MIGKDWTLRTEHWGELELSGDLRRRSKVGSISGEWVVSPHIRVQTGSYDKDITGEGSQSNSFFQLTSWSTFSTSLLTLQTQKAREIKVGTYVTKWDMLSKHNHTVSRFDTHGFLWQNTKKQLKEGQPWITYGISCNIRVLFKNYIYKLNV